MRTKKYLHTGAVVVLAVGVLSTAYAADVSVTDADPQVFFDDTNTVANPDWTLTADETGFFVTNNALGQIPLFVNALDTYVGIGTTSPQQKVHIRGNMNPMIRIQVSGTEVGYPAYTWDIRGNSTSFALRDVTAGSIEPFRVVAGAPTDSLKVGPTGNVGVGPAAPASSLHVYRSDGTAVILAEEVNALISPRNMFELRNNGPVGFNMNNTSTAQTWRFAAQTDGFRVSLDGTGGPEMIVGNSGTLQVGPGGTQRLFLDAVGNLTIAGTLTQSSDRSAKTNISDLNGHEVLAKLTALPVSQWAYKGEPGVAHIGPMAQDFHQTFGLGADDKHIAPGDLASVAVMGVKELHKLIEEQDAKIAALNAQIAERDAHTAEIQARLMLLERLVSRVAKQGFDGSLALNSNANK